MDKNKNRSEHHFVQTTELSNSTLFPVRALKDLMNSRKLSINAPLFADKTYHHVPVIDTKIRDALNMNLQILNIPQAGHRFHAFHHSGSTLAFDSGVQLEVMMVHRLWRSSAVWSYLQNSS